MDDGRSTAVIFCHTTLLGPDIDPEIRERLRRLLRDLKAADVQVAVFTTHAYDVNGALSEMGFPEADQVFSSSDFWGLRKGDPIWIERLEARTGVPPGKMLYVGDDDQDWRSAINFPVLYLHAKWSKEKPPQQTSIHVNSPRDVWEYLQQFIVPPPRFAYQLDVPDDRMTLRSLLPASTTLAGDTNSEVFTLQDIFTRGRAITVGKMTARNMLVLHAVTSLVEEGTLPRNPWFVVYPSSQVGKLNGPIADYLEPLSKTVHGFHKDDLLVRRVPGRDTSLERVRAAREGRESDVSIADQTRTVCLNRRYRGDLSARHIVVFDDFTTTGASLEWARNLLLAAGAEGVTLLTIGKYPKPYLLHRVKPGVTLNPFELELRGPDEIFDIERQYMTPDSSRIATLQRLFERQKSKALESD